MSLELYIVEEISLCYHINSWKFANYRFHISIRRPLAYQIGWIALKYINKCAIDSISSPQRIHTGSSKHLRPHKFSLTGIALAHALHRRSRSLGIACTSHIFAQPFWVILDEVRHPSKGDRVSTAR